MQHNTSHFHRAVKIWSICSLKKITSTLIYFKVNKYIKYLNTKQKENVKVQECKNQVHSPAREEFFARTIKYLSLSWESRLKVKTIFTLNLYVINLYVLCTWESWPISDVVVKMFGTFFFTQDSLIIQPSSKRLV